tara:strand:+ start:34 stop:264 length:231 start_codon:yes stop_codon:yes gene_type:complete
MSKDTNIQIYVNKKEVVYTRKNMIKTINTFLLYLTNPDLDELSDRCKSLKEHRHQKEQESKLEENRTPIQSNRYDT